MPGKSPRIPKYRHYRPKNLAVVRINGKDEYLGKYDSPESWERYHRRIAEWLSDGKQSAVSPQAVADALQDRTINELVLAYWRFAKGYYSKNGHPTKELACMREALQHLQALYGTARVDDFGPKSLKAVRQHMLDQDLSRGVINHRVGRIKRMFKWGVAEELVSPSVFHGLQAVGGLRYGRSGVRDTAPIKPVPKEWVDAVLPYLSPTVVAMVEVQGFTGMRPCEVILIRPCDIDRSNEIWVYEPYDHKNRWRGHERKIPLGPRVQSILLPLLDRDPAAYLFSPRESDEWRRAKLREERKTPMTPSQAKRKPKKHPKRPRRDHYDTSTYQRAIKYGINKANKAIEEEAKKNGIKEPKLIPHWFPLQIRHAWATDIRKAYGLDAAQASLGHARADITEVYAEKNFELATKIAKEMG